MILGWPPCLLQGFQVRLAPVIVIRVAVTTPPLLAWFVSVWDGRRQHVSPTSNRHRLFEAQRTLLMLGHGTVSGRCIELGKVDGRWSQLKRRRLAGSVRKSSTLAPSRHQHRIALLLNGMRHQLLMALLVIMACMGPRLAACSQG